MNKEELVNVDHDKRKLEVYAEKLQSLIDGEMKREKNLQEFLKMKRKQRYMDGK